MRNLIFHTRIIIGLLAAAISIAGCSGGLQIPFGNPGGGGLLTDPANETQSAIASQAAQSPTPLPTATLPSKPTPQAATPQPTETLTPAAETNCSASDLLANTRSDITGATMVFKISLSNAGNRTCTLIDPPEAFLSSLQGSQLDIQSIPGCTECLPKSPPAENQATITALSPTQTAEAQGSSAGKVRLGASQSVGALLIWKNWCDPFPPGGITINLDLGEGRLLTMPTDAQRAGTCVQAGQPSTLNISPYYRIP